VCTTGLGYLCGTWTGFIGIVSRLLIPIRYLVHTTPQETETANILSLVNRCFLSTYLFGRGCFMVLAIGKIPMLMELYFLVEETRDKHLEILCRFLAFSFFSSSLISGRAPMK
jgi:hypothetical protein